MNTINQIQDILAQSKKEHWPYPKTFNALRDAGVSFYQVIFSEPFEAFYEGSFGRFEEQALPDYSAPHINPVFSAVGIQESIKKHLREKTSYLSWLNEAASQGAASYTVNMSNRTVTYFNLDKTKEYIEHVPEWTA